MLFRNNKLDEALRWIEKLDFDVLCLQEVPEAFLEKLRSLPWHLAVASEGDRLLSKKTVRAYAVIVSKNPIAAHGEIALPDIPTPLLTRLFIRLMRPFHFCRVTDRHAVYADIATPHRTEASQTPEPLRVISVHLSLSFPEQRARELALVLQTALPHHTIVCGDFNIIESPKVSLLNWLMGGSFRDILAYMTERAAAEAAFAEHGLKNPLRDQLTHPFALSQLDHILVPTDFAVKRSGVSAHLHGSDHRPIFVQLAS